MVRWSDGKNAVIFGVNSRSSVHIDVRNETMLVLGEKPIQELDNNTITAEDKYPIKITESGKKICI